MSVKPFASFLLYKEIFILERTMAYKDELIRYICQVKA